MVGWMSYWSQRSETGVRSRRWSRRMAAFSWALGRFRVFLGMGEPLLEIVAYSSGPFFPFRLKQNKGIKPVYVGLALAFFFPLGLYLLWRHPTLSRKKAWWWVGGVWSLFVIGSAGADKDKK